MTLAENTINKEYRQQDLGLQRVLVAVVTVCLVALATFAVARYIQPADPYVQEVLSLEGAASRGQEIFQMNCAVCHGLEARGEVGPSLLRVSSHKSEVSLIKQVVSGKTPPMPQFQPNPQDMADLLRYLETL